MEITGYVVVGYEEGEMVQESVRFKVEEVGRAIKFLTNLRERKPDVRYELVGILRT